MAMFLKNESERGPAEARSLPLGQNGKRRASEKRRTCLIDSMNIPACSFTDFSKKRGITFATVVAVGAGNDFSRRFGSHRQLLYY